VTWCSEYTRTLTFQNFCKQLQNLLLAQHAEHHAAGPKQSECVSSVIGVPASPSPPASPLPPPPPAEPAEPAPGASRDWNLVEELLGQLERKQAELEGVTASVTAAVTASGQLESKQAKVEGILPSHLARKPLDKDTELEERERELRALADRPLFSNVLYIVSVT
jgi:hypothetical protein